MQAKPIPVKSIQPNPQQPRKVFDLAALQELANSIRSYGGVVQPIVVTPNGGPNSYFLVDGERRWRAAQLAGLKTIDAVIKDRLEAQAMLEQALVANLHRADLNPIEEARAYQRLMDEFGLKVADVAAKAGKQVSQIYNRLQWLKLEEEIQHLVEQGTLGRDYRLANALEALPPAVRVPLAHKLAKNRASLKACLSACEKVAAQLADPAKTDRAPMRRRATTRAAHTPDDHTTWPLDDVRQAAARMCAQCDIKTDALQNAVAEPGWALLVHAADQTCGGCNVRDIKGACDACPGVELLRGLIEMSKIKRTLHDATVKRGKVAA